MLDLEPTEKSKIPPIQTGFTPAGTSPSFSTDTWQMRNRRDRLLGLPLEAPYLCAPQPAAQEHHSSSFKLPKAPWNTNDLEKESCDLRSSSEKPDNDAPSPRCCLVCKGLWEGLFHTLLSVTLKVSTHKACQRQPERSLLDSTAQG